MNHMQLNFRRLEQRCMSPKERSIDYFNSETNQSRLPCIDQVGFLQYLLFFLNSQWSVLNLP